MDHFCVPHGCLDGVDCLSLLHKFRFKVGCAVNIINK
jgi:hypothetical protein